VGRGRVEVELDGTPWRTIPVEVAARVGVWVDAELDRSRLRALARELRRTRALGEATRALAHRDYSARTLAERLGRRGIAPAALREALEQLERAGYVDDARFALARARALAERGRGDAAIRADLERRGIAAGAIEDAVSGLESEEARAARILAARGRTPATLRRLVGNGFAAELVAELAETGVAREP
jgi:regulatory protein